MLVLSLGERGEVLSLSLEKLGRTSQPSALCYLDSGVVFVGSCFGDCQLLRLSTTADANGDFISEVAREPNIGPIIDFAVVDLERHGQGQVVTCSGAFRDGSLRVVRNRVGIDEHAIYTMLTSSYLSCELHLYRHRRARSRRASHTFSHLLRHRRARSRRAAGRKGDVVAARGERGAAGAARALVSPRRRFLHASCTLP